MWTLLALLAFASADPDVDCIEIKTSPDSCGACDLRLKYFNRAGSAIFEPGDVFIVSCFEVEEGTHEPVANSIGITAMGQFADDFRSLENEYYGNFRLAKTADYSFFYPYIDGDTDGTNGLKRPVYMNYEFEYDLEDFQMWDAEPYVKFDSSSVEFHALAVGGVHRGWSQDPRLQCWAFHGDEAFDPTQMDDRWEQLTSTNTEFHSCYTRDEAEMFQDLFENGFLG